MICFRGAVPPDLPPARQSQGPGARRRLSGGKEMRDPQQQSQGYLSASPGESAEGEVRSLQQGTRLPCGGYQCEAGGVDRDLQSSGCCKNIPLSARRPPQYRQGAGEHAVDKMIEMYV